MRISPYLFLTWFHNCLRSEQNRPDFPIFYKKGKISIPWATVYNHILHLPYITHTANLSLVLFTHRKNCPHCREGGMSCGLEGPQQLISAPGPQNWRIRPRSVRQTGGANRLRLRADLPGKLSGPRSTVCADSAVDGTFFYSQARGVRREDNRIHYFAL